MKWDKQIDGYTFVKEKYDFGDSEEWEINKYEYFLLVKEYNLTFTMVFKVVTFFIIII